MCFGKRAVGRLRAIARGQTEPLLKECDGFLLPAVTRGDVDGNRHAQAVIREIDGALGFRHLGECELEKFEGLELVFRRPRGPMIEGTCQA